MAISQDGMDYGKFFFLINIPLTLYLKVCINAKYVHTVYFSEIQFGSKNKTFYLVIDTGSSDTWVPSSNCLSQACTNHETYGKSDSDTLKFENLEFSIQYGTGSVTGVIARDDLSFAGFNLNMEFGLATALSSDFIDFPIDGIMGLGFPETSQQRVDTVMQVLAKDKLINKTMFSVALSRASDQLQDGVIHFGRIDPSYFTGKMVFSDTVTDMGYWEVAMDDVGLDGKFFNFVNRTAIIDTGTSVLLLPPDDAYKVHYAMKDARTDGESFAIPCDTNYTIEIKISGVTYNIPASDWVGVPTSQGSKYCSSNIMSRVITGNTTWLLGDVFLKNVYSNFNFDSRSIGFATRASPYGSTVTTSPSATNSFVPITATVTVSVTPGAKSAASGSISQLSGFTTQLCFILSGFFLGLVLV